MKRSGVVPRLLPVQRRTLALGGTGLGGRGRRERPGAPGTSTVLRSTCPAPNPPCHLGLHGGQSLESSEEGVLRPQCPARPAGIRGGASSPSSPPLPSPRSSPTAPTPNKQRHRHKRVRSHTHPHITATVTLREVETGHGCSLSQAPAPIVLGGRPAHAETRAQPRQGHSTHTHARGDPALTPAATATDARAHVLSHVHRAWQVEAGRSHTPGSCSWALGWALGGPEQRPSQASPSVSSCYRLHLWDLETPCVRSRSICTPTLGPQPWLLTCQGGPSQEGTPRDRKGWPPTLGDHYVVQSMAQCPHGARPLPVVSQVPPLLLETPPLPQIPRENCRLSFLGTLQTGALL